MSPTDRILRLLSEKPGLRAQQIAVELELERSQVAALLTACGEVTQDSSYRWWSKTRGARAQERPQRTPTFLANLCRYYFDCLSRESGPGISIPSAIPRT